MPIPSCKTAESFQAQPTVGHRNDRVAVGCPRLQVADRVLRETEMMPKLVVHRPDYFGANILPVTTHAEDRPPEDDKHVRRRRRLRSPAFRDR